jgi:hypothetical protein
MRVSQIICEALSDEEKAELKALTDKLANDPSVDKSDSFWGPLFRKANEITGKDLDKDGNKIEMGVDRRGFTAATRRAAIDFNKSLSAKQILWAQNALRRAGIAVVGRDGVNDETFIGALYDFQRISAIPPTGKYDMRTIDALRYVMKQATGSESGVDTITQKDADGKGGGKVISDFGNTAKDFAALPGKPIPVPGKNATLKIIAKKPYENDPETTVVLYASQNKDGTVTFDISGVNPKDRTEFVLDQASVGGDTLLADAVRNINKMKEIFAADKLRLKGPYTSFNGSLISALAAELLNSPK